MLRERDASQQQETISSRDPRVTSAIVRYRPEVPLDELVDSGIFTVSFFLYCYWSEQK